MDLSYGEAAEAYRTEVCAFLASHWPPAVDVRGANLKAFIREFRAAATEAGYLYRAIPKRYGGSEQPVDVIRAQVIREEYARARAPMEVGGNGMNMCVDCIPCDVQIFWPLMIHLLPSSDNSPLVRTLARSDPDPGSE